jgi:hypothetical protein
LNLTAGFVEKSQFLAEHTKRPTVGYEVMECQRQDMLILAECRQRDPEQRPTSKIKRLAGLRS